jgi:tetratricopeptide (TPR) repeat protein
MRKALEASPKEGIIHVMIARTLAPFNNLGAEERELREARKDGAPDFTILPQLFVVLIERHDENRLLTEFTDPAPGAKGDTVADILDGRAKALLSLGRLEEAAAEMDRALSLRRDVPGLLDRATIAARQNNKALSTKLVDEAYQLAPKEGRAVFAKLKEVESSGNTVKTLAFSEQMLKNFPNRVDVRTVRIETFLKLNQNDKAKAEVDAILAQSAKSPYGLYYKAILLARANDKPAAWQLMLQIPPAFVQQNPALGSTIAQIAFDTGHADAGATVLANVLTAAPDLLDVRLQLADLRVKQNTPQSAMVVLTPVKDSADPRVKKLLAKVQAQIAKDRSF